MRNKGVDDGENRVAKAYIPLEDMRVKEQDGVWFD